VSLLCLVSAKGAPGVTLTSLALTASWPGSDREKVLLEADCSGGTLAIRYRLGRQPGLVTLAAAGGHGIGRSDLWSHVQELPGGLGVIVAPERGDRARPILDSSGSQLGSWLAAMDGSTVVADCGRIDPSEAGSSLAAHAEKLFVVARPTAEEIQPAASLARAFIAAGVDARWVLIGDSPHSARAVQDATGIEVERVLPDDSQGADAIVAGRASGRRYGRLARSIASWAQELARSIPTEEHAQDVAAQPLAATVGEAWR
jgi:MinD-like ATPase involved in chromosome partitioning or flagellar assembly